MVCECRVKSRVFEKPFDQIVSATGDRVNRAAINRSVDVYVSLVRGSKPKAGNPSARQFTCDEQERVYLTRVSGAGEQNRSILLFEILIGSIYGCYHNYYEAARARHDE